MIFGSSRRGLVGWFAAVLILLQMLCYGAGDDLQDTTEFVHAMDVKIVRVDDFPVVFHYGQIRPDFSDYSDNPLRQRIALDGAWLFRFDPQDQGITQSWFAGEKQGADWRLVTVPHCWDMMPGGRFWDWNDSSSSNPPFYNGAAWYRRSFEYQPIKGKCERLEFLGVQQRARVYLNGKPIALHEGGGQPFSVDVTKFLVPGKNVLALKVVRLPNYKRKDNGKGWDEMTTTNTQHPVPPDNWPYAGILRSVSLVTENAVAIRKIQTRTMGDHLEVILAIANLQDKPVSISADVKSPAFAGLSSARDIVIDARQNHVVRFHVPLKAGVAIWSPGSPNVHALTAVLAINGVPVDQLRSTFGIRSFCTDNSHFLLNGKPVFLKGVSFYEENAERGGALNKKDHEVFFRLAKEANVNFLRLHVSERDPYVYHLADESGMMVIAEWGGFWYRENSMRAQTADAQSIYQSLAICALWDLMNHPSIVLWGLHNESHQFCAEYEPFLKMGRSLVRALDWQSRPVTWAAWHPNKGTPHHEIADAVGFNEYRGAMDPFEDLDPDVKQAEVRNPGKPLIILENGAWSVHGCHGAKTQKSTEEWQADLLVRQHDVLMHHPSLAGYTYWLLMDYRSRKPYTANPTANGYSYMGMYSAACQPKLVRDVFRDMIW